MGAFSGRDGSKGPMSLLESESESDCRLLLELGTTRNKDGLELLDADRRAVKTNELCNAWFQDAAAAGAQLTIVAMFNSTALRTTGQCAHACSRMGAHKQ
jgi:hypothetical protein